MLDDLILGPSQVRGAMRLLPLIRVDPRDDLRLGLFKKPGFAVVNPKTTYTSYLPHAFVVEWGDGRLPVATIGTQIKDRVSTSELNAGVFHRSVKRVGDRTLRFVPMHLAMEGLLAAHFAGPSVQWGYFSHKAISKGFSPRIESSYSGWMIEGFDEALRTFEILDGQCGVLVFVADALATAFVTPHPDDYRLLHDTLIQDFFGELIWQYAILYPHEAPCDFPFTDDTVKSIADLKSGVQAMRNRWDEFGRMAASGLNLTPVQTETLYKAGPFTLERFIGSLDSAEENHIGERIVDRDGRIQYLKTFRLSASQARRAGLIKQMADHDWNIEAIAAKHRLTAHDIILQYGQQGFEWMFRPEVVDAAKAYLRKVSA